jgi:stage V sporulation protein AE
MSSSLSHKINVMSKQPVRRDVILITDGDDVARGVIEQVAKDIGGQCITCSAGNPTPLSGQELVSMIMEAESEPVLVMFDDNGQGGSGKGEQALREVALHPGINVLGAIAVASNTVSMRCAHVDVVIDGKGRIVEHGVNKEGDLTPFNTKCICGDTVELLDELPIPIVVGIGDIGKMKGRDHIRRGAPITHKAIQIILERGKVMQR